MVGTQTFESSIHSFVMPMKNAFRVALLATLPLLLTAAALAPNSLHSQLFLAPAEQFLLGGNQEGSFKLDAYNAGKVPVSLSEQLPGGTWQPIAELQPGARTEHRFGAGAAARVRNLSATAPGEVHLTLRGHFPRRLTMQSQRQP